MATLTFAEAERELGTRLAALAERADAFARHSPGHSKRVALLCERIADRLGLREPDLTDVKVAALARGFGLHALSLGALERSGPLTFAERVELWRHPLLAEQQLAKRGGSRHAQLLVRWHHEWWSGLGYPDMLAGDAIPLGSRVIRAAETYLALLADRPHRPALEPAAAREEVAAASGVELDPDVAAALLSIVDEAHEPAPAAAEGAES